VATVSGLLQIIGLFCKRALQKRRYPAKETYNFKEPIHTQNEIYSRTHNSHVRKDCGVATVSGLLQIIGLFCKRALQKGRYPAKETYNFKEPIHTQNEIYSRTNNLHVRKDCGVATGGYD